MNKSNTLIHKKASAAGNSKDAKSLFKDLYESGTDEASVYAQYFNLCFADGDENAIEILEAGRKKFPENTEILFSEINF